ncbi:MAG: hypothetical protein Q7U20_01045 [Caulobacter sp.]|nr:hypothetical protein [Caulobacter sp.]
MTKKSILLGLSAIGSLVLADAAAAQVLGGGVTGQIGATGQITAPAPTLPVDRAAGAARSAADRAAAAARRTGRQATATAGQTVDTARDAAATGADASATAATRSQATFPPGTVVRDSAGVEIGTVMSTDPSTSSAGRVAIKTSTGFITVPASSLSMQGDVAISARASADVGKPQ